MGTIATISRKEAKHKGLKRYYTGKPCKHGHVDERTTSNGVCMECSRIKALRFWEENPDAKARNRAAGLEASRNRYKSDDEFRAKTIDRAKKWHHSNRERASELRKARYLRNYEAVKEENRNRWRKYREDPAWVDRERARKRQEMKDHPERRWASYNARRARMKSAEGKTTAADVKRIIQSQNYLCVYCKACLKDYYEVDHIIPIAKGGSNWPSNMQCLCRDCNRSKSSKDPIDFAKEKGLLL